MEQKPIASHSSKTCMFWPNGDENEDFKCKMMDGCLSSLHTQLLSNPFTVLSSCRSNYSYALRALTRPLTPAAAATGESWGNWAARVRECGWFLCVDCITNTTERPLDPPPAHQPTHTHAVTHTLKPNRLYVSMPQFVFFTMAWLDLWGHSSSFASQSDSFHTPPTQQPSCGWSVHLNSAPTKWLMRLRYRKGRLLKVNTFFWTEWNNGWRRLEWRQP